MQSTLSLGHSEVARDHSDAEQDEFDGGQKLLGQGAGLVEEELRIKPDLWHAVHVSAGESCMYMQAGRHGKWIQELRPARKEMGLAAGQLRSRVPQELEFICWTVYVPYTCRVASVL
jgi:hypothetical protein